MRATAALPGRFRTVDGLELYHEVRGHAERVVLIHGALGTIQSCFAELLPELALTRKVIAVELQGHRHNHRPARRLDSSASVTDLVRPSPTPPGPVHKAGVASLRVSQ